MWISYDNTYEVSDGGEVRNKKTGRILKQHDTGDGYFGVDIHAKSKKVARMIGERFLPLIDCPGLQIDHIDRNTKNNSASNLRWVSALENTQNKGMYKTNTSGYKHIYKRSDTGSYTVLIKRYKTVVFRKTYKTIEEAIAARDAFTSSWLHSVP
jgi:hypothetical protein